MTDYHFHRRNLPHIYIPERTYFITFRLNDSLPVHQLIELRNRPEFTKTPRSKLEKYNMDKLFFAHYDKLLHSGRSGNNCLAKLNIADIVKSSIIYWDGKDYKLIAYCIMPNHVHFVFSLKENARNVDKITQSIKRFSARQINILLNIKGSLWQAESYDHIVRDDDELFRIINYVINNPVKAGSVDNWTDWKSTYVCEDYTMSRSD